MKGGRRNLPRAVRHRIATVTVLNDHGHEAVRKLCRYGVVNDDDNSGQAAPAVAMRQRASSRVSANTATCPESGLYIAAVFASK